MDEEKNLTESNQPEEQELNPTKEQAPLTKEEILERSRKENSHGDERSVSAMMRAGYIAMIVGGVLCVFLYWLYYHLLNEDLYGLFIVYAVMWAVFSWVQFYYTRKKAQLVCGILLTVGAVCFLISFILQFAGID